jgi:outer membrane receptor protein involved in Fe transport
MKPLLQLLALAFFATPMAVFAQQKQAAISGQVTDAQKKALESATVALLQGKDSSVIKYGVADKSGRFVFENLDAGQYLVLVSAAGFEKKYSAKLTVGNQAEAFQLPILVLDQQAKSMSGVTVTAKRPLVEQKIDRTVVNVEASITNAGSNALEVLEKAPGVTVDKDGNISLKGKEGVMVLVDGRPTQLGSADLANLLRNMNASQLDQVEIMTNPPARFDAAGNAGIINIKTKKTKQFGFNGSATLSYGQGRYAKINESVNLNYRKNKVALFGNFSHNHRKNFQRLDIQRNLRNFNTKELEYYFDQEAHMQSQYNSINAKLGADYFLSKKTTLGVSLGTNTNPGKNINNNLNQISDEAGNLFEVTKSVTGAEQTFRNVLANANFRHQFDSTGRELTADVDHLNYRLRDQQYLSNYYFDAHNNQIRNGDTLYSFLPQDINIWSGKADYLQPLKGGARFEAGLKSSIVKTDNNARFDSMRNGTRVFDATRSNHFIYEEHINAAYVNLAGPLGKKWNGQLGLRLEQTVAKGTQVTIDSVFKRNYLNLFPTAFIQYKASDKNVFGLNYGRRIRRPNYESLNPFVEYLDRYTFQQGNPNLQPQFSHNVELSHTYRQFLTTTLNYTRTTDIIQQVIEQNTERKEAYVKQANIAQQRQVGIAVNASLPITKWWTSSIFVNASDNRFEGIVSGENIVVEGRMLMLNGTQQFKLSKTWSAEASGFYRTAGLEGVLLTRPVGIFNLGVAKQVMNNKGSIRLNVRDVFYTMKFKAETRYANVDAQFQEWRDSRVANLTFTYRFSKGKMNGNAPKRRTGSATDEQERIGGN